MQGVIGNAVGHHGLPSGLVEDYTLVRGSGEVIPQLGQGAALLVGDDAHPGPGAFVQTGVEAAQHAVAQGLQDTVLALAGGVGD